MALRGDITDLSDSTVAGMPLTVASLMTSYRRLCTRHFIFIILIVAPCILVVLNPLLLQLGTAAAQWLRCCATNRKVDGSIPAGVIGIFH